MGRVGRYQLLEPIGVGPTGTVSRAKVFGVAGFERQFAIKRFHTELTTTATMAQSLSAAARAYGGLEHPRIARMSEFGVAQGTTFTAVELVSGLDATRLIAEARLANTTLAAGGALALVSQAARAVGYAHGRGLTHLGLSPTNVIVTPEGDVKITDFGILSSTLPQRPIDVARLAQRIQYLAPEQLTNEATSAATDVFALGVLAYELVTGQRTFHGETPQQVAQSVMAGPPTEPPLPRPIARVLQRCLARSPFERFPDARALADALDAALRVAPVPGTRKDIGTLVKQTLERLAELHTNELSGVVAFNFNPGALGNAPVAAPYRDTQEGEQSTTEFVRPDTPVSGPAPLVGPVREREPSASATMPEVMKPPSATVMGMRAPPIPMPQSGTPAIPAAPAPVNPSSTLLGMSTTSRAVPAIPTIKPPQAAVKPTLGAVPPPQSNPPTPPMLAPEADLMPPDRPSSTAVSPLRISTAPHAVAPVPSLASRPSTKSALHVTLQGTPSGPTPSRSTPSAPMPSGPSPSAPTPSAPSPSGPSPSGPVSSRPMPSGPVTIPEPLETVPPRSPFGTLPPSSDSPGEARTDLLIETDPNEVTIDRLIALPPPPDRGPELELAEPRSPTATELELELEPAPAPGPTAHGHMVSEQHSQTSLGLGSLGLGLAVPRTLPPTPELVPSVEDPRIEDELEQTTNVVTQPERSSREMVEQAEQAVAALDARHPDIQSERLRPKLPVAPPQHPGPYNLETFNIRAAPARSNRTPWIIGGVLGFVALVALGFVAKILLFDGEPKPAKLATAAPGDAGDRAHVVPADAAIAVAAVLPDAAAAATPRDAAEVAPADAGKPPTPGDDVLTISSTPAGARVFLDGADAGATPLKLPGTLDRHTVALVLPGHELYVAQVDGHGSFAIPMKAVTPSNGPAGIKVLKCSKDRFYVFVDGKPTGQNCPTERIGVEVGPHVVEVYDVVSETRRKWEIEVKDTRLSYRVKVE